MPKVSIIVPCWGVEKYLNRCVESLVRQTLKDIEIILVDDESPDRVPEMCDEWAKRDIRIKVVHKKNEGLGMACNSGMVISSGEYIAFCDSDDWVEENMYEQLYKTAIDTQSDAVYSGIQTIDEAGNIRPMSQPSKYEVISNHDQIISIAMDMICSKAEDSIESHIAMSAKVVLYKRRLLEMHHLQFESERRLISEDLVWNLDVLGHASVITLLPKTFYYYYINYSSLSKKVRLDRFKYFVSLRKELYRRVRNMNFPNSVGERIDRLFLRYVRSDIGNVLLSDNPFLLRYKLASERMNDNTTQEVLKSFPLQKLVLKQQIIMRLIRHKFVIALYLLFKIGR